MTPYYEEPGITIYCADCRDVLPGLPRVDLVLTDPPYGETAILWDTRAEGWLHLVNAPSLWCFGSMRFFLECRAEFDGWKFGQEIIWEKQNGSGFAIDRFNRVHEIITHWYHGQWSMLHRDVPREMTGSGTKSVHTKSITPHRGVIGNVPYVDDGSRFVRSVIRCRNEHSSAEHPTQKPIELVRWLVSYSCAPNGTILDPFMGSGTTLVAAKQLGRRAIGIEIERKYCDIAVERLRQDVLPLEAPAEPAAQPMELFA